MYVKICGTVGAIYKYVKTGPELCGTIGAISTL